VTGIASIQQLTVTLTETDFGSLPTWLDSIILRIRVHGASDWRQEERVDPRLFSYSSGSGTLTAKVVDVAVGDLIDVGIAYRDMSGAISATAWPSGLASVSDPNGAFLSMTGGTIVRPLASGIAIGTGGPQLTAGTGVPTSTPSVPTIYLRDDPVDWNSFVYLFRPSVGWQALGATGL
jgi:hypothetical protein